MPSVKLTDDNLKLYHPSVSSDPSKLLYLEIYIFKKI